MSSVIVIGGGAAGMMSAITAARAGKKVTLIEKNEKLGKKLFITGKGRCNFTNAGETDELFDSIVTNKKFMYSAFYGFDNMACMRFFEELGLKYKIERGNRVFPESDHSSDVIGCLSRELRKLGVEVMLNTTVTQLVTAGCEEALHKSRVTGVLLKNPDEDSAKEKFLNADSVIVATGGKSYESTGSTGDGYKFAKSVGHSVTPLSPALVPIIVKDEWVKNLQGLSLKNISIEISDKNKVLYSDFGEMMFTHFGVTGPVILSASSRIAKTLKQKELCLTIDLKPALSAEVLDERVLRDFKGVANKQFKNSLDDILPKKIIPVIIELSKIPEDKRVNEITKEERHRLVLLLKGLTMTLTGLRGFNEAIITQGGVNVKEISPSTFESKLVKDLYFAGEVLDVDAVTGGFNLQVAWSSGYLAGNAVK